MPKIKNGITEVTPFLFILSYGTAANERLLFVGMEETAAVLGTDNIPYPNEPKPKVGADIIRPL